MSEKKERNIIYDKVRGVAILLVVLGHVIQYSYSDFFMFRLLTLYIHFICHYLCF